MTMSTEDALSLLGAVVQESHARGRRTTAAALKARVRRRSLQEFDEKLLGFVSFRAFLREAQTRGIVALHAGEFDVFVTPPGASLPEPDPDSGVEAGDAGAGRTDPPRRIRSHLWRAFVDWSPGLQRFYDRVEREAFLLPARPSPREREEHRLRREMVAADAARFAAIEPIPFDQQLGWMHDFTDRQNSPIKEQLQLALGSERPARDFAAQISTIPTLSNAWHRHLVDQVGEVIKRWAASHHLNVEIFVPVSSPAPAPHGAPESTASDATQLRAILHRAIDRMPEQELMAISLPVGYLIDTRGQG